MDSCFANIIRSSFEEKKRKKNYLQILYIEVGNDSMGGHRWCSCKISAFRLQGPQFDPGSAEI